MLCTIIEAVLFAIARPISLTALQKQLGVSQEELAEAVRELSEKRNTPDSGIYLVQHDELIELVTNPVATEHVTSFIKADAKSPLTRASLETLTVIAYLGPVSKAEIEYVRGVNCSLILRNLLIRGAITEKEVKGQWESDFIVSVDFLHELGLKKISDLPDYEHFHQHEKIQELLQKQSEPFV